MRTLLLLRHAEAAPAPPGGRDRDRPLTAAGEADARRIGDYVRERGYGCDVAVCSTARRARQTLSGFKTGFRAKVETHFEPMLYDADDRGLDEIIFLTPFTAPGAVLFVGHNPAVEWLANHYAVAGAAAAKARLAKGFPPGGLAVFDLEQARERPSGRAVRLVDFVTPATLPDPEPEPR